MSDVSMNYLRRIAVLVVGSLYEGKTLQNHLMREAGDGKFGDIGQDISNYKKLSDNLYEYENQIRERATGRVPISHPSPENIMQLWNELLRLDLKNLGFTGIDKLFKDLPRTSLKIESEPESVRTRSSGSHNSKSNRAAIRKLKNKKYSKNKKLKTRKTKGIKKKNPRRR